MTQSKLILVILDGLNYTVARDCMGFLQALVESQQASLYKLQCELPSLSRPLYECILTGITPVKSGITHNYIHRNSNQTSLFSLARAAGLRTAAAAYYWFSELYNRTPYLAKRDRFTVNPELMIQYACFYHHDSYIDSHLYLDAEYLRCHYDPHFLLVHPMGIDDAGHRAGVDSSQYRNAARSSDLALADYVPTWLAEDYQIIITADHGMNADKSHGGILPEEREVPLYVLGSKFSHNPQCPPKQVDICGIGCELLGIKNHKKTVTAGFLQAK